MLCGVPSQVRNGRPRPVVVEIPTDVFQEDVPEPLEYKPVVVTRSAPDPLAVTEVAQVLWMRNAWCSMPARGCTTPKPGPSCANWLSCWRHR